MAITLRGMKAFLLNFLLHPGRLGGGVVGGFYWQTVSTDFLVNTLAASKNLGSFADDLRTGKLDGEACVLRYIYLFVCLLFVYSLLVCVFAF